MNFILTVQEPNTVTQCGNAVGLYSEVAQFKSWLLPALLMKVFVVYLNI
jgi:hypothetical protein